MLPIKTRINMILKTSIPDIHKIPNQNNPQNESRIYVRVLKQLIESIEKSPDRKEF